LVVDESGSHKLKRGAIEGAAGIVVPRRHQEETMSGWILFVVLFVWYIASMVYTAKKMNNLESYVVFLLLSDDIRSDHKKKFQDWISNSKETRPDDLRERASDAVKLMADSLAKGGSALSSSAFIWRHKSASEG
jgi:hypothetical protein